MGGAKWLVVFNDDAYGNVARDLDEAWGGSYGADLYNPDFMKLADAFGVVGLRAKAPDEVGRLVADADLRGAPLVEAELGMAAEITAQRDQTLAAAVDLLAPLRRRLAHGPLPRVGRVLLVVTPPSPGHQRPSRRRMVAARRPAEPPSATAASGAILTA